MIWTNPPVSEEERQQRLALLDAIERELTLRAALRRLPVWEVCPVDGYGRPDEQPQGSHRQHLRSRLRASRR